MQVIESAAAMRAACRGILWADVFATGEQRSSLGLVPTMGALHRGHLALVEQARQQCGQVAVSIFVNPLQFGPHEDLDRYPRQLARDLALLDQAGVELVFTPPVTGMYRAGATTTVEPGALGERLDGAHRPGHFRGVATVVAKLFHIVEPTHAFFGQKDAVQVAVLRQMVRDLDFAVEMVVYPIVRDTDGLALSSRNAYLSAPERQAALALPRALEAMQARLAAGERDAAAVLAAGHAVLAEEPGVALEYLVAVHADTLLPVNAITPGTLLAVAGRVGTTRLIDNFLASAK